MKLIIYDKNGRNIREINEVNPHGFKTMYLGLPERQVLMFTHGKARFQGSIDLVNGMTFALYQE